jgi:hypothetical protein
MSNFLSRALHGVGHAVQGVGHVVGSIASNPLVDGLIGATLGPGAAAAAGGFGRLIAPGGNVGQAALGGVEGYGAGKVGQIGRSALGGLLHGGAGGVADASAGGGGIVDTIKGAVGGAAGGLGGLARSALGGLTGEIGSSGLSPAVLGLAGLGMANSAQLGSKANDFADKAWGLSNDSYNARSGLRSSGIDQLLHPQAPQTGGLTALRMQNPVAARAGIARTALTPGGA